MRIRTKAPVVRNHAAPLGDGLRQRMHRLFFRPPDFVRVIDIGVGDDDILRPNQLIGHQKLVLDSLRHTFNDNRLCFASDCQANKRELFHDADRAVFLAIFCLRAVRINPACLGACRFGVGADSGGVQRRGDCSIFSVTPSTSSAASTAITIVICKSLPCEKRNIQAPTWALG